MSVNHLEEMKEAVEKAQIDKEITSLDHLSIPKVGDAISLTDSVSLVSDDLSAESQNEKKMDDDITVSSIDTIDSVTDFSFDVCYFIFKHLKKVIGWDSPFLKLLDVVVVISVYLSVLTATFTIAFYRNSTVAIAIFYLCDGVYAANLLFISFVALSPASAWSTPNQLVYRKQCRWLCLIDLFTVIPLEFIAKKVWYQRAPVLLDKSLAFARLNRLLRAYRFIRFFKNKKNVVVLGTRYSDILSASCALSLVIHISACLWYSMNCNVFRSAYHRGTLCWSTISEGHLENNLTEALLNDAFYYTSKESKVKHSWTMALVNVNQSVDLGFVFNLYTICAYWSTLTVLGVGYGDYCALNYEEVVLSVIVMIFGAAITNGLVIGNLTSFLTNVESQRATFTHRLKIIKRYLADNDYATNLSESIQGFYEYIWFKKKGQTNENIYGNLPLSLQSEICLSVNRCALSKSPMFQNLDEGFLRSIALMIQSQFYLPGQLVINKGTVSRSMYYVVRGELEVLSSRDDITPVAVLRPGKLFGEVNLVLNFARTASIRAATHCDLLVLEQNDVTPVLMHYPEARLAMWNYVEELFEANFDEDLQMLSQEVLAGHSSAGHSYHSQPAFSPNLSTMVEEDEDLISSAHDKDHEETEGASKRSKPSISRFPNIKASPASFTDAKKSILSTKSIHTPILKNSGTASDMTSVKLSSRNVQNLEKTNSLIINVKQKKTKVHLAPSSMKESEESLMIETDDKLIPAFQRPGDFLHIEEDSTIRHRQFSWDKNISVYKQVRRPTMQLRGMSELQLGSGAAVLRGAENNSISLLMRLWKYVRRPRIEEGDVFDTIWKGFIWLVVLVQWYLYLYYASFADGYSPGMLSFTYVLDIALTFDLMFTLMTIVISPRKTYETYRDIFQYRIRTFTFYLDFVAAFPLDVLIPSFVWFLNLVKRDRLTTICKLNKLTKVWVVPRRFKYFEDQLYVPLTLIRPVELIIYILMGIHFSACLWFMDANIDRILFEKPSSDMWLKQFTGLKVAEYPLGRSELFENDSYILSLYWATATMSTTGYGDIVSMTTLEYCISMFVMVLGLGLFAYSLASYASLLSNIERPKVKFHSIVFAMQQFMLDHRLDKQLRKRVLRYMELQWHAYDGLVLPTSIPLLHDLPEALQHDLAADGMVKILGSIKLFRGTDVAFRQELSRKCSRHLFPPNEYVLYSGDLGRDMYIIVRGYCELYLGRGQKSLGLMGPGMQFGETGMLYGLPRPAHVITRTHCDLLVIPHGEFQRIMKQFPTVNKEIKEVQENAAILHAVKLKHAHVWRMSKDVPQVNNPLSTEDETPSFTIFSEDADGEYEESFEILKRLSFLRKLLMRRTVRPDSQFAVRLECFHIVVVMLVLVMTPMHSTFLPHSIRIYIICMFLDVVAITYMYVRLHVAYYNEDSILITHPSRTAQNYVESAFFLDLVACFPFDLLAMLFFPGRVYENITTIVLFRLNRMIQAYNIYWAFSVWERDVSIRGAPLKTIKYAFYFGIYVHILACFWAYYACPGATHLHPARFAPKARFQELYSHNYTEFTSLNSKCRNISWYSMSEFADSGNAIDFYIVSVLYTLEMIGSVGYGHMTPRTHTEFILSIILMIHGVMFFGYVIASVTASFVNADITRAVFNERVKKLRNQMDYEKVSTTVQKKVLQHIEYEFFRSQGMQAHVLFTNLPPSIRGDVALVLFESLISSVPIFSTIDRSFHRMLSMCLKEAFFLEGETVIYRGDMGQEMYFIHRGLCDIIGEDGDILITLGPGRFFGEVSVMFSIPRTVSIQARTNADLFVLTRNDLHDVLENYPDIKREIERIAIQRLQTQQQSDSAVGETSSRRVNRSDHWPGDDLPEPHHGRKHKSHRHRSLANQLHSALHSLPLIFSKGTQETRRPSVLEKEYEEMLESERKMLESEPHNRHPREKHDSIAVRLIHAVGNVTHDWFSTHTMKNGNLIHNSDSAINQQESFVEDIPPSMTQPSLEARPHNEGDDRRKMEGKTSHVPMTITVSICHATNGSQSILATESNAISSETNFHIDGQATDDKTHELKSVPPIQLSPSTENIQAKNIGENLPVPSESTRAVPASNPSRLSLQAGSLHSSLSQFHEVYISDQSITVESEMSFIPEVADEPTGLAWARLSPKTSHTPAVVIDSSTAARRQFQPPPCAITWYRRIRSLVNKVLPSDFVFVPRSKYLLLFNLLLTVLGVASIIQIVYQVAFVYCSVASDILFGICTLAYTLNIFIRMHTAYYDHYGDLVRDYVTVRRTYMHRPTGFLVDFLSALPVSLLILISPDSATLRRSVSMIRLVQLARAYTAFDFYRSWERQLNAPLLFLRCMRDFGLLLMLLHVCSCLWCIIGCPNSTCLPKSWIHQRRLLNASHRERYVNAIYFITATMTSTGYGDIHPGTIPEAIFTIFVIMIGKFALGLIIGDLASTMSNLEVARVEMESMLGLIVNHMKDQMVPMHLQKRVVEHVKYDWNRNRGHCLKDLLENIPHCLRVEVFEAIYGAQLRSISIFEQAPDYVIRRLSCLCEQQVFLPGDFITKRGDIGHKVFVIRRGSVMVYITSPDQPEYYLYSGAIYGDVQIVYPTIPYEHHLVAEYASDVLVINQNDIQLLLADSPHFYFKVRRYIQKKYAYLIQNKKPSMVPVP